MSRARAKAASDVLTATISRESFAATRENRRAVYVFGGLTSARIEQLVMKLRAMAQIASAGSTEGAYPIEIDPPHLASLLDSLSDDVERLVGLDAVHTLWLDPALVPEGLT